MSKDISTVPLTVHEDLDQIAERYALDRRGLDPEEARRRREQVITELLPFAKRLAGRYRNTREPAADLEQVARVGLVKAVNRYDPQRGSFTAFAVSTVSGELKRYFRDHTWGVRVPRRMQDLSLSVTQAEGALTAELGRRPTDAEIAGRCGVRHPDVAEARRTTAAYRPVSFSLPLGERGRELGETFGDIDEALDRVPDLVTLRALIDRLPARERRIVLERFYGNHTQAEIGARLGISQMHVSRLLNRTLDGLRTALLTDTTPSWLVTARSPKGSEVDKVASPSAARERDGRRAGGSLMTTARDSRATLWLRCDVVAAAGGGATTMVVGGDLDRDSIGELRLAVTAALAGAAPPLLRLDLAAVPFIDSAGIRGLLDCRQRAVDAGGGLTVVAASARVRQILDVTGLTGVLGVEH